MSVKRLKPLPKSKPKTINVGLALALEVANYELQVKKQARRELAINKEVQAVTDSYRDDIENEATDWLYGSFALALHRKYGFGSKRIAALFDMLQDIKNELIAEGIDHEKIWDMVRDEIGLDIQVV